MTRGELRVLATEFDLALEGLAIRAEAFARNPVDQRERRLWSELANRVAQSRAYAQALKAMAEVG